MLPPTVSRSAQKHLVTGSYSLFRFVVSPATTRVLRGSATISPSPRLATHGRSCWSWSRHYDRTAARAQLAHARVAHKIVKARMFRDIPSATDSLFKYRLLGSQLGWRSSSSWNPKDRQPEELNKEPTRKSRQNLHESERYNDDLFELSDREKAWRAKSDALRRWIEENPYDALFGYSNRLGRFDKGGLFASFSRWTSLNPDQPRPTTNSDAPASQTDSQKPPDVISQVVYSMETKQQASVPVAAVPAKPTKMGHASSTPRTSTMLSEADLVYDPISNRMVRSGNGEFSHYAQELDVGTKHSVSGLVAHIGSAGHTRNDAVRQLPEEPAQKTDKMVSTGEEYAMYKSKRLPQQEESPSWLEKKGHSRESMTSRANPSALASEQRTQTARRAKLTRKFDKVYSSEAEKMDVAPRRVQQNRGLSSPTRPIVGDLADQGKIETALDRHLARKCLQSTEKQSSPDRHDKPCSERSEQSDKTTRQDSARDIECQQDNQHLQQPGLEEYLEALSEAGAARKPQTTSRQPSFDDYLQALSEAGAARKPRTSTKQPEFDEYLQALSEAGAARKPPAGKQPGFEDYLQALSEAGAARKSKARASQAPEIPTAQLPQDSTPIVKTSSDKVKSVEDVKTVETDEVEFASMDEPFVVDSGPKFKVSRSDNQSEDVASVVDCTTASVVPGASSHTYTVLAYDQMTNQVTSAEVAAPATRGEEVTPLSVALMQLKEPAKFLPHLEKLRTKECEVVSSGENLLILKHVVGVSEPVTAVGGKHIKVETPQVRISCRSTNHSVNPIDRTGAHVPTGDFASPTGFINWTSYDSLTPNSLLKSHLASEKSAAELGSAFKTIDRSSQTIPPGDPRSKHGGPSGPRRMEPVFSGGKSHRRSAEWKRHAKRPRRFWRFVNRVAAMFGFTAAFLYVAGLIIQMRRDSTEGKMVWSDWQGRRKQERNEESTVRRTVGDE